MPTTAHGLWESLRIGWASTTALFLRLFVLAIADSFGPFQGGAKSICRLRRNEASDIRFHVRNSHEPFSANADSWNREASLREPVSGSFWCNANEDCCLSKADQKLAK